NVYRWLRLRKDVHHRQAVFLADSIREIRDYNELLNVHEGLLLFDEAHMWLPSRQFDLIPVEVIAFWSQHRKAGVDVLLATQRYGSVDAIVRDLVAFVYWARPAPAWLRLITLPWTRGRRMLRYTAIMDESVGVMQRQTHTIWQGVARTDVVVLDPLAAACYDTCAIFEPPIVRLQRELDPKRRAIFDRMGLAWDSSKVKVRSRSASSDGLPALSISELAQAYREGKSPHEVLRAKLESTHEPGSACDSGGSAVPAGEVDWSRFVWSG
ncbi:MAG: zonular occludens toxin domain-containing protein, partial [Meiothermus sp.]|uniref:zonular occludens toxin domain-containing protein n=1 Tax=Meiothermus sp. TaxID=1955249 RepID=UPI00260A1AE6